MGKGIYYFGGSAVFRLPYLFLLKNILFEIKINGICNRLSNQGVDFSTISSVVCLRCRMLY